jgi:toxin ParE1/3/4
MNIRYRARALADLEDIFLYLNERSPNGARNVLHAIRAAILEVAEHPRAAPSTSELEIRVKILGRTAIRSSTARVMASSK